jgi:hypothetical protein
MHALGTKCEKEHCVSELRKYELECITAVLIYDDSDIIFFVNYMN